MNVNQCNFIGRLGQDPEIRYTPNGDAVANLSIAVSEKWKDKQGNQQEKTDWIRLTAYRKLAEIVGEYVKKGSLVYVSGKMQTRKWQNQQGQDQYTTEIILSDLKMLSGRSDSSGASHEQQQGQRQQGSQQAPKQQTTSPPAQSSQQGSAPDMDFSDDLPF